MHILVVVHDFELGGAERIAIRLAGAWARGGHRVTIACGRDQGPLRAMIDPAIEVVAARRPIRRSFASRGPLGRFVARVGREADVVFLPGNYYWDVAWVMRLMLGRRRPAVVGKLSNVIGRPARGRLGSAAYAAGLRAKARFLDRVVAMSEGLAGEARLRLRARVRVIANPVIEGEAVAGEARDLVAAGRLTAQKNFDLLLEALAKVPAKPRLTIYGDGPLRGALEARAAALGVAERVTFAGYVPELALGGAQLLVLSSDYEGFPSVVVEALAAGVPVVATNCSPAISELVSGEAGRVEPVRDADALAVAIADMLASPPPDAARLRARAEPYRLDRSAAAYLELFAELTG